MKNMKIYTAYSKIEFRRLLNLRSGAAALLFFVLAMILTRDGVYLFREHTKQKEEFKKIELEKVKKHLKYETYGSIGMKVYFAPDPLEIFFNKSGAAPQMTTALNAGERLSVDTSLNGRDMFKNRGGNFIDFGGLMMLGGYLIVIFYGVVTFRDKRYRQMLAKTLGCKRLFWQTVICRYQVMGLFFLAVTAAAVGLVLIDGIVLSGQDYIDLANFVLDWQLTALFLFVVGSLIGKLPSRVSVSIVAIIFWFFAVLVLPAGFEKIVEKRAAAMKSHFLVELEKWNHINAFEQRAIQEAGKFDPANANTKTERDLVESFIANEYQNILAEELQVEKESAENAKFYRDITMVFPTTSHRALTNGLSGKGYDAGVGFYRFSRITKEKFADFYKQKRYYSNDKKVVPFIQGEQGVYYVENRVPGNFLWGLLIKLGWLIAALAGAWFVNRNDLYGYRLNPKAKKKNRVFSLNRKERRVIRAYGDGIGDYIYNVLSGKGGKFGKDSDSGKGRKPGKDSRENQNLQGLNNTGKKGKDGKISVIWEGRDIVESSPAVEFIYIGAAGDIPGDIPVGDLLAMRAAAKGISKKEYEGILERLKIGRKETRYGDLPLMKQYEVLVSFAEGEKGEIYIFRNTALEMPAGAYIDIKERMEELVEKGAAVVYLTTDSLAVDPDAGEPRDYRKMDIKAWDLMIEGLKRYQENKEKREKNRQQETEDEEEDDEEESEREMDDIDLLNELLR